MIRLGGAPAGVAAALRVPLWLRGRRWTTLLRPAPVARPEAEPARGAVAAALFTVRLLGRIPGGPWRNTCLYRAIAECLVLRAYGVDARLRIGVGTERDAVIAHAWVVRGAQSDAEADPTAAALRTLSFRA